MHPTGFFSCFCNLFKQLGEIFTDLLTHVTEAVEQRVYLSPTKERLIKQLVWKGLNVPTCNAVAVVCNENIYKWILATINLDPSHGLITSLHLFPGCPPCGQASHQHYTQGPPGRYILLKMWPTRPFVA